VVLEKFCPKIAVDGVGKNWDVGFQVERIDITEKGNTEIQIAEKLMRDQRFDEGKK
jgi:hypothetical protein